VQLSAIYNIILHYSRWTDEVQTTYAQKKPSMNGRGGVFVWLWSLSVATTAVEEKVCGSIDVRNSGERFSALHNCTIVNGYVQIVLLDATKPSDFDISFPLLREITQYLVVYRVAGLYNLGKLFPNLMLIRGSHSPHFPGLALMIHDNLDLREIGLYSLTNITRGSVIISKNPSESCLFYKI